MLSVGPVAAFYYSISLLWSSEGYRERPSRHLPVFPHCAGPVPHRGGPTRGPADQAGSTSPVVAGSHPGVDLPGRPWQFEMLVKDTYPFPPRGSAYSGLLELT